MQPTEGCKENSKENTPSDVCPFCHGDEWIMKKDENGNVYASPCVCREAAIMKRRKKFADIPEAFQEYTLDNFGMDIYQRDESKKMIADIMKIVRYYIDDFEKQQEKGIGIYFYSNTKGSGKTRMAASIANELMKNHQVKFASSPAILAEIKSTYDNNFSPRSEEVTESKLLDFLITTEILIIDDFGTEKITGWVNDKFYHIINERYVAKKVTIFTSNDDIENVGYDSRITNRVLERTYQIPFPEECVRKEINKNHLNELLSGVFRQGE